MKLCIGMKAREHRDASRSPWCAAHHAAERRCPERLWLAPVGSGTGSLERGDAVQCPLPTYPKKTLNLKQVPG